jgi:N-acetylglucosaminyldiphosphoundecaprenol N-acetyl-beta-D-mannosaminyltransferase
VVETLAKKIEREYPGIYLCGYENGYVKDKDAVLERIAEKEPDISLIALGAPMQELLIRRHMASFKKGVLIGVGGSFDVLSGMKKRAPQFFVKCNLEWLYRIVTEPKRLKRFWNNNIKFLFVLRKESHE